MNLFKIVNSYSYVATDQVYFDMHVQSWESYFIKVIYYILATSYSYEEVTRILQLHITLSKSNSVILLLLSKVISKLVTSYQGTLKVYL